MQLQRDLSASRAAEKIAKKERDQALTEKARAIEICGALLRSRLALEKDLQNTNAIIKEKDDARLAAINTALTQNKLVIDLQERLKQVCALSAVMNEKLIV